MKHLLYLIFTFVISASACAQISEQAFWNTHRSVAIDTRETINGTRILAYIVQQRSAPLIVDLSMIEKQNLGKLGIIKNHQFKRVQSKPIRWIERNDGLFQVEIETQVWKNAQRFRASELIIFKADGTLILR